ncbi:MAG: J domain-containing protein [bacterium]|nr:J domain-containing protein [bacterium]
MAQTNSKTTRRRKERTRANSGRIFRVCVEEAPGRPRWVTADLFDHSDGGLGVSLAFPLTVGGVVSVRGRLDNEPRREVSGRARVAWCMERSNGTYHAGLEYEQVEGQDPFANWGEGDPSVEDSDDDHYDALQISPNADQEVIHRIFRLLAQRFHPDNDDTGEEATFKRILTAYRILSNPEQRAAYDANYQATRRRRWRIFDQGQAYKGMGAERRKRMGLLRLLYTQRSSEPDRPFMTIHALEDLLGCPRHHLQMSLWYLRVKGYVNRSDDGRFSITADGIDLAEAEENWEPPQHRMIAAAKTDE